MKSIFSVDITCGSCNARYLSVVRIKQSVHALTNCTATCDEAVAQPRSRKSFRGAGSGQHLRIQRECPRYSVGYCTGVDVTQF